MFVEGVVVIDPHPIKAGSFGDVFRGKLDGGQVAVKRVRIMMSQTEEERAESTKVWHVAYAFLLMQLIPYRAFARRPSSGTI